MNAADPYLDELVRLMPPAERVFAPMTWEDAEATFEVQFPDSYKAFLDAYGTGVVMPELAIYDPRHEGGFRELWRAVTETIDVIPFEELRADVRPPYHGFPAPGRSLLSIACNGNGEALYIVVEDGVGFDEELWIGEKFEWHRMNGPFCRLLADLVAGRNRDALGDFDYWAWHLEPTFVASPDSDV